MVLPIVDPGAVVPVELQERLGRDVRDAWVTYCRATQTNPKPSHVAAWADLGEWDKAVDRFIGTRIAAPYIAVIRQMSDRNMALHSRVSELTATLARAESLLSRFSTATTITDPSDAAAIHGTIAAIRNTRDRA